ncbi:unnamed protein product [Gordionus sp. m RMFG-2023]
MYIRHFNSFLSKNTSYQFVSPPLIYKDITTTENLMSLDLEKWNKIIDSYLINVKSYILESLKNFKIIYYETNKELTNYDALYDIIMENHYLFNHPKTFKFLLEDNNFDDIYHNILSKLHDLIATEDNIKIDDTFENNNFIIYTKNIVSELSKLLANTNKINNVKRCFSEYSFINDNIHLKKLFETLDIFVKKIENRIKKLTESWEQDLLNRYYYDTTNKFDTNHSIFLENEMDQTLSTSYPNDLIQLLDEFDKRYNILIDIIKRNNNETDEFVLNFLEKTKKSLNNAKDFSKDINKYNKLFLNFGFERHLINLLSYDKSNFIKYCEQNNVTWSSLVDDNEKLNTIKTKLIKLVNTIQTLENIESNSDSYIKNLTKYSIFNNHQEINNVIKYVHNLSQKLIYPEEMIAEWKYNIETKILTILKESCAIPDIKTLDVKFEIEILYKNFKLRLSPNIDGLKSAINLRLKSLKTLPDNNINIFEIEEINKSFKNFLDTQINEDIENEIEKNFVKIEQEIGNVLTSIQLADELDKIMAYNEFYEKNSLEKLQEKDLVFKEWSNLQMNIIKKSDLLKKKLKIINDNIKSNYESLEKEYKIIHDRWEDIFQLIMKSNYYKKDNNTYINYENIIKDICELSKIKDKWNNFSLRVCTFRKKLNDNPNDNESRVYKDLDSLYQMKSFIQNNQKAIDFAINLDELNLIPFDEKDAPHKNDHDSNKFSFVLKHLNLLYINKDKLSVILNQSSNILILNNLLKELDVWSKTVSLKFNTYTLSLGKRIGVPDNLIYIINQIAAKENNISSAKHLKLEKDIVNFKNLEKWRDNLKIIKNAVKLIHEINKQWIFLEPLISKKVMFNEECHQIFFVAQLQWINVLHSLELNPTIIEYFIDSILDNGEHKKKLYINKLNKLNENFTISSDMLNEYLENKRVLVPRLYFINHLELLTLLSDSQDIATLNKYVPKLYCGINKFEIDEDQRQINFFISEMNERLKLAFDVNLTKNITEWLNELSSSINVSLVLILRTNFLKINNLLNIDDKKRKDYFINIENLPFQMISVARQLEFTNKCEYYIKEKKLNDFLSSLHSFHKDIAVNIEYVENLYTKSKLKGILMEQIYFINIVKSLINSQVYNTESFGWKKFIRYYSKNLIDEDEDLNIEIHIWNNIFHYNFEFLPFTLPLVYTNLTEKCFLISTNALANNCGADLYGIAGTGKTETVKELGRYLGKRVIVINCHKDINRKVIERLLYGINYCKFWGCFDEFNRLDSDNLLNISEIFLQFKNSLAICNETNNHFGYFLTMNPQNKRYLDRAILPDYVKDIFVPISMQYPNVMEILQSLLALSYHGLYHDEGALKFYNLILSFEKILSGEIYYDWSLRSILYIIQLFQNTLKKANAVEFHLSNVDVIYEYDLFLLKSLQNIFYPKMNMCDQSLINYIIQCYYNIDIDSLKATRFLDIFTKEEEIISFLKKDQYFNIIFKNNLDYMITKCIETYQQLSNRSGILIIGPPKSGKTLIVNYLQKALKSINNNENRKDLEKEEQDFPIIYPNCLNLKQIFGNMDFENNKWTDGLFTFYVRNLLNNDSKEIEKWIIFKGHLNPLWVESLNSILDENHILVLASGEIINFQQNQKITINESIIKLIFVTDEVSNSSPATLSRLGVIVLEDMDKDQYYKTIEIKNLARNDCKKLFIYFNNLMKGIDIKIPLTKLCFKNILEVSFNDSILQTYNIGDSLENIIIAWNKMNILNVVSKYDQFIMEKNELFALAENLMEFELKLCECCEKIENDNEYRLIPKYSYLTLIFTDLFDFTDVEYTRSFLLQLYELSGFYNGNNKWVVCDKINIVVTICEKELLSNTKCFPKLTADEYNIILKKCHDNISSVITNFSTFPQQDAIKEIWNLLLIKFWDTIQNLEIKKDLYGKYDVFVHLIMKVYNRLLSMISKSNYEISSNFYITLLVKLFYISTTSYWEMSYSNMITIINKNCKSSIINQNFEIDPELIFIHQAIKTEGIKNRWEAMPFKEFESRLNNELKNHMLNPILKYPKSIQNIKTCSEIISLSSTFIMIMGDTGINASDILEACGILLNNEYAKFNTCDDFLKYLEQTTKDSDTHHLLLLNIYQISTIAKILLIPRYQICRNFLSIDQLSAHSFTSKQSYIELESTMSNIHIVFDCTWLSHEYQNTIKNDLNNFCQSTKIYLERWDIADYQKVFKMLMDKRQIQITDQDIVKNYLWEYLENILCGKSWIKIMNPQNFYIFTQIFFKLYENYFSRIAMRINFLESGISLLNNLRVRLEEINRLSSNDMSSLKIKQSQLDEMIVNIKENMEKGDSSKINLLELKNKITKEKEDLNQQKYLYENRIKGIAPLIEAAQSDILKIREEDLYEIKSLRAPPIIIRDILEGVLKLMGSYDTSWNNIKSWISKKKFKEDFVKFNARNVKIESIEILEKHLMDRKTSFEEKNALRASVVAAPLAFWVKANLKFIKVLQNVIPIEKKLSKLEKNIVNYEENILTMENELKSIEDTNNELTLRHIALNDDVNKIKQSLSKQKYFTEKVNEIMNLLEDELTCWKEENKNENLVTESIIKNILIITTYVTFINDIPERNDCLVSQFNWIQNFSHENREIINICDVLDLDDNNKSLVSLLTEDVSNVYKMLLVQQSPFLLAIMDDNELWLNYYKNSTLSEFQLMNFKEPDLERTFEIIKNNNRVLILYNVHELTPWLIDMLILCFQNKNNLPIDMLSNQSLSDFKYFNIVILTNQEIEVPKYLESYMIFVKDNITPFSLQHLLNRSIHQSSENLGGNEFAQDENIDILIKNQINQSKNQFLEKIKQIEICENLEESTFNILLEIKSDIDLLRSKLKIVMCNELEKNIIMLQKTLIKNFYGNIEYGIMDQHKLAVLVIIFNYTIHYFDNNNESTSNSLKDIWKVFDIHEINPIFQDHHEKLKDTINYFKNDKYILSKYKIKSIENILEIKEEFCKDLETSYITFLYDPYNLRPIKDFLFTQFDLIDDISQITLVPINNSKVIELIFVTPEESINYIYIRRYILRRFKRHLRVFENILLDRSIELSNNSLIEISMGSNQFNNTILKFIEESISQNIWIIIKIFDGIDSRFLEAIPTSVETFLKTCSVQYDEIFFKETLKRIVYGNHIENTFDQKILDYYIDVIMSKSWQNSETFHTNILHDIKKLHSIEELEILFVNLEDISLKTIGLPDNSITYMNLIKPLIITSSIKNTFSLENNKELPIISILLQLWENLYEELQKYIDVITNIHSSLKLIQKIGIDEIKESRFNKQIITPLKGNKVPQFWEIPPYMISSKFCDSIFNTIYEKSNSLLELFRNFNEVENLSPNNIKISLFEKPESFLYLYKLRHCKLNGENPNKTEYVIFLKSENGINLIIEGIYSLNFIFKNEKVMKCQENTDLMTPIYNLKFYIKEIEPRMKDNYIALPLYKLYDEDVFFKQKIEPCLEVYIEKEEDCSEWLILHAPSLIIK